LYNDRADVEALVGALKKITAAARRKKESEPMSGWEPDRPAKATDSIRDAASGAEVQYPIAAAPSVDAAGDELAEMFEFLGEDPNAKARFVMEDLAPMLPDHFELLKKATTRLQGCMSEVYLVGRRSPKDASVVEFVADANSQIVRGEIVMLQKLFSGQKAQEVLAFDLEKFFQRIGLEKFLTNQRRTGLASMVKKVRGIAERG
jgi:cysteine desulfurase/selenocysteine lyase